jgi:hypothetical protein
LVYRNSAGIETRRERFEIVSADEGQLYQVAGSR